MSRELLTEQLIRYNKYSVIRKCLWLVLPTQFWRKLDISNVGSLERNCDTSFTCSLIFDCLCLFWYWILIRTRLSFDILKSFHTGVWGSRTAFHKNADFSDNFNLNAIWRWLLVVLLQTAYFNVSRFIFSMWNKALSIGEFRMESGCVV